MNFTPELTISILSAVITLFLLIFTVDWQYFRDWIVAFLFIGLLSVFWGNLVVEMNLIKYPFRILPQYFETSLLFDLWIFPTFCILYNQTTRKAGLWQIFYLALLFSGILTAIEYPLEKYTELIDYLDWSWFTSFSTLTVTFLSSRLFISFYRWGCSYFHRLNK